jgi:hypothetical protein
MDGTPHPPRPHAKFDVQAAQAPEAPKRSRERLETTEALLRRPSDLRAPTNDRLAELRSLVKRPAVQERIATEVALVAREADRKGKVEMADLLWSFVRHTRVRAMKMRVLTDIRRQGGA